MMKVIYLSPNMQNYGGAFYQQDVIDEMRRQSDCYFYGPRYPSYEFKDNIIDINSKSGFIPDLIIVGHAWLNDAPKRNIEIHPILSLSTCNKKIFILNKEHSKLNEKLQWTIYRNWLITSKNRLITKKPK